MGKKIAICTTGRYNPPTKGHEVVLNQMREIAQSVAQDAQISQVSLFVFPTRSQDSEKNPLPFDYKVDVLEKLFGRYFHFRHSKPIRTILEGATYLDSQGFDRLILVVGSDRVVEFKALLDRYNGKPDRQGNMVFEFDSVEVMQAGARRTDTGMAGTVDPDEAAEADISASGARNAVREGHFDKFLTIFPQGDLSSFDHKKLAKDVFETLASQMDVKLETSDAELQESWRRISDTISLQFSHLFEQQHLYSSSIDPATLYETVAAGFYAAEDDTLEGGEVEDHYLVEAPMKEIVCSIVERAGEIVITDIRIPDLCAPGKGRAIVESAVLVLLETGPRSFEDEQLLRKLQELEESFATVLALLATKAQKSGKILQILNPAARRAPDSIFNSEYPSQLPATLLQQGIRKTPPRLSSAIHVIS